MQNTLKGWLADNTVTIDNKEDKILLLESAGSVNLDKIYDEKESKGTGLRCETRHKDGSATSGHNLFVRGVMLSVKDYDPLVGATVTKQDEDRITINKLSELTLLVSADLVKSAYTLTMTIQSCQTPQLLSLTA